MRVQEGKRKGGKARYGDCSGGVGTAVVGQQAAMQDPLRFLAPHQRSVVRGFAQQQQAASQMAMGIAAAAGEFATNPQSMGVPGVEMSAGVPPLMVIAPRPPPS